MQNRELLTFLSIKITTKVTKTNRFYKNTKQDQIQTLKSQKSNATIESTTTSVNKISFAIRKLKIESKKNFKSLGKQQMQTMDQQQLCCDTL